MTPQEKAVIEAVLAVRRSWVPLPDDLRQAVDALIEARRKPAAAQCGASSPSGAMHCTLKPEHSLPDRDNFMWRYHRGYAADGSARYWREYRP